MATVSFTTNGTGYASANDTQTINVTGATFTYRPLNLNGLYYYNSIYSSYASTRYVGGIQVSLPAPTQTYTYYLTSDTSGSTANGAWSGAVGFSSFTTKTLNTNKFFTSTNPTVRTITGSVYAVSGATMTCATSINTMSTTTTSQQTLTTVKITLDVPPTFDVSNIYYDTNYVYAGLTTASVDLSNLSAKYGGTVTSATLTIGNQTDTIQNPVDNDTLSILLNQGGTLTPTVTITDSRGQTATQTLDAITVNVYNKPTVAFNTERTTSTGTPDDEGTYAVINPTFTFTDVIATLTAPTVTVTDQDGTTTTVTPTWYSSRAQDGTLSGTVTWANLTSPATVYGLISGFNTQYSYQISVTPEDSEDTGTAITQTLGSAFYTMDFLAGGHGIAFGQPASQTGFHCNMDAYFNDMTSQEVDDFIDSIGGGGSVEPIRINYASGVTVPIATDVAINTSKALIGDLYSNSGAFARVTVDGNIITQGRATGSANTVFPVFLILSSGQTLRLSPSDANATFDCKLYDIE